MSTGSVDVDGTTAGTGQGNGGTDPSGGLPELTLEVITSGN